MQISLPRTSAERNRIVRIIGNGAIGLAAGTFAASGIFATVDVAPYWSGFWTGVICTVSTGFGAGLGLIYKPSF